MGSIELQFDIFSGSLLFPFFFELIHTMDIYIYDWAHTQNNNHYCCLCIIIELQTILLRGAANM